MVNLIFQEKSRQEDEIRRRMMEEEGKSKCGAVQEILVLIAYAQKPPLKKAHANILVV